MIPKNEIVWRRYYDTDGKLRYITTSKQTRDFYFLYEVSESGETKKLGKGTNPPELEEKFNLDKILRGETGV